LKQDWRVPKFMSKNILG